MPVKVLLIEDSLEIARIVQAYLEECGYRVSHAVDGLSGLATLKETGADLVLLDLTLPGMDGLAICRHLRSAGDRTPIIMLTSRDSEQDIVLGLELGADDYLTKPFSLPELKARMGSLLRRTAEPSQPISPAAEKTLFTRGGLHIDVDKRLVTRDGVAIVLTAKEFDLLLHLARHPGRVYSRDQLLNDIWGYDNPNYEHTVSSHVNRLRNKIEPDPANPVYILTAWGVGYRFADSEDLPPLPAANQHPARQ